MKKHIRKALTKKPVRFGIVGIFNTLLNFALLNFAFFALGQGQIASGIIATCVAMMVSFFLNRNFVFKPQHRSWRQPVMFAIVTASGVLLVQNAVYILGVHIVGNYSAGLSDFIHGQFSLVVSQDFLEINISNVAGSLAAMVWNYNGYKFFVFNDTFKGNNKDI